METSLLLATVSYTWPCGGDLEYDSDFLQLDALGRSQVQHERLPAAHSRSHEACPARFECYRATVQRASRFRAGRGPLRMRDNKLDISRIDKSAMCQIGRKVHRFVPVANMIKAARLALIAVLFPSVAQAGQVADSSLPMHATLLGQPYVLENQQQRCALRKPDQSILPLDIPSPCHFSIGKNGQAHVETFQNVPIIIVLHVAPVVGSKLECRSQYKAVRLIKGQLEPSVLAHNASCLRGVGDQKNYTAMFDW